MRVRITDPAGNEVTSATQSVTINSVGTAWDPATVSLTATALTDVDPLLARGVIAVTQLLDLDQSPASLPLDIEDLLDAEDDFLICLPNDTDDLIDTEDDSLTCDTCDCDCGDSGGSDDDSGGTGEYWDSLGLQYWSEYVDVQPIIQATLTADNAGALPDNILVELTWDGNTQAEESYSTSGYSPGDQFTVAAQVDTAVTTSGRYAWTLQVTADYATPVVDTVSGTTFVVSRDDSPFGAGWWPTFLDQLIDISAAGGAPAGQLRVLGSGGWLFYEGTTTFTSPAGDEGTLVKNQDDSFTYTALDGRTWNFDADGRQTALVSADGLATIAFDYTGSDLTGIEFPDEKKRGRSSFIQPGDSSWLAAFLGRPRGRSV